MISILINGSPTKQFPVNKELRQGDPLSPFLFLIVAEGLNGLMSSAIEKELYKGVLIGNGEVMVTLLQFADDTIFFREASEDNIRVIKCIMRTFELASGLKINYGKSQIVGIEVEEGWIEKMEYKLCCKVGEFPMKYLGIPIGANHRKLAMWQPLVDSFKRKLASWKGILKSIDKIHRSFLWGGEGVVKIINWVSWERVCKQKEHGGLGVRDLRKFNLALMGKWWGRLATNGEGLWKKVIVGKYGGEGDIGLIGKEKECYQMGNTQSGSWKWNLSWRRILFQWEEDEAKELYKMIEEVKIYPRCPDEWEWRHSEDGLYSTSIAYAILRKEERGPVETKFFKRRGVIKDMGYGKCTLCEVEDENTNHLFLNCNVVKWIWVACANWWGITIN
ncbi:hypothetical protein SLEP1_g50914 [Rubroshorea leprosula]|uniref:Reverse transcriptase domain-containing protein n=1 Tax=Rubroshorea leprosula TaxID=152421 RepID=A0AAV5M2C8_9ROSI|nr:hypothetical protein SLEP1_g50914 [Rubroshorea leprosula]